MTTLLRSFVFVLLCACAQANAQAQAPSKPGTPPSGPGTASPSPGAHPATPGTSPFAPGIFPSGPDAAPPAASKPAAPASVPDSDAGSGSAKAPNPALTGRVVDQAHMLDAATTASLSAALADFERKSGTQVVVVTIPSLKGVPIEDFGYQLGRRWGIGQKGKNNGALLIVSRDDHKLRIEVGYGLEGTLTDALSSAIINQVIVPAFRQGNFNKGIADGTMAIIKVLDGDPDAVPQPQRAASVNATPLVPVFFIVMVILLILLSRMRNRAGLLTGTILGGSGWGGGYRGGGGGGGGGGGFGGGGGGGFSGGGGSFGGGGSSGSW